MAVQLTNLPLAGEVRLCRHCGQPLNLRPIPSPIDPWSTTSWWTIPVAGDPTPVCPGAGAVLVDCPACWGSSYTSAGVACVGCAGTGRRADHAPVVSA